MDWAGPGGPTQQQVGEVVIGRDPDELDDDHEHVEHSSTKGVLEWIQDDWGNK